MEEKERYSYDYFIDGAVFIDTENGRDMDMDTVCSLLNKQNKRIKELELLLKADKKIETNSLNGFEKLRKENEELKQQLHDLPKKIIRDIADELGDCGKAYLECEPYIKICIVKSILQAILKKYGDKNESNND